MSEMLKMSHYCFCIGIYDINNLKAANGSLGHEVGDKLISDASRIICKAFKTAQYFELVEMNLFPVSPNVSEKEIEIQHNEMLHLLKEYNIINPYNIDLDIAFGYTLQSAPFSVDKLLQKQTVICTEIK